jgi:hypothetical protein
LFAQLWELRNPFDFSGTHLEFADNILETGGVDSIQLYVYVPFFLVFIWAFDLGDVGATGAFEEFNIFEIVAHMDGTRDDSGDGHNESGESGKFDELHAFFLGWFEVDQRLSCRMGMG